MNRPNSSPRAQFLTTSPQLPTLNSKSPQSQAHSPFVGIAIVMALLLGAAPASAQNWSFDARRIALGNAGGADNPATEMIADEVQYRAIVIPLGLFQVLSNTNVFKPDSDEFDIVKAIELASSPLHYVVGRDDASESNAGRRLVTDIRNAELSRDLNVYRGFVPARQPAAEGLAHSAFGATIPVYRGANGTLHGIFVGAGPYFSMRAVADVDQRLIDVLDSDTNVYVPNSQFLLATDTRGQLAAAITAGYRGRFGFAQAASERDGLYVSFDYNYLHGFMFEDVDTNARLDTDAAGLLTVNLANPASPLVVSRNSASSGRGFSLDLGLGVVSGIIEAGFGVKGIANRINWTEVERTTYSLGSLLSGDSDFVESVPVPVADVRVELPKDYRTYAGARLGSTFVVGEFAHGFNGDSFRTGVEQGMGFIDLRGGMIYSRQRWAPTGGVGLNFGKLSLDLAAFGTSANVERQRRLAFAASLRINGSPDPQ